MRLRLALLLCALSITASTGCGYAAVATSGDAAIVVRNDYLLFGALRKVYVCRITETGLTQCSSQDSP